MDKKIFDELEFSVCRADFEKAEQMIENFKKQYSPGSEEYGELCYYELLTHYKVTNISELKYYFIYNCRSTLSCKFCNAVVKYSNATRKAMVTYISISAGKFQGVSDYIQSTILSAERYLKEKDYKLSIDRFLEANEKRGLLTSP